ncbi:MAG: HlyC/CorC family transporter [Anaplasmataceae bacterium]|nr:HlyC/CorC family transporter [Anaplasmataceae bacterium]
MLAITLLLTLFFLFGSTMLSAVSSSLQKLGRLQASEELKEHTHLFFYQHIARYFFRDRMWEGIFFSTTFTRQCLQICYAVSALFFLLSLAPFEHVIIFQPEHHFAVDGVWVVIMALILLGSWLFTDLAMRLFADLRPALCVSMLGWPASIFLTLLSPLSALSLHTLRYLFPQAYAQESSSATVKIRDKILEIIHESELAPHLDQQEQKLIASIASFKERVAREIMVPRVKVFSLPSDTTIAEAAQSFVCEGYSRIPVYHDNVDHVIGVLLYKDVLNIYALSAMQAETPHKLSSPIEALVKPVLYTPETKRISHLLQEFRSKQIHLAIVVDEYGGTEGIVTIEDILEELVGEIADEHDIGEKMMYTVLPDGGWTVDARMGILDIEKELGVKIPTSPEYDTIGGYIFHRASAIPSKGWRMHHDDFDLEVLSSDERSIEKIKISPHKEE